MLGASLPVLAGVGPDWWGSEAGYEAAPPLVADEVDYLMAGGHVAVAACHEKGAAWWYAREAFLAFGTDAKGIDITRSPTAGSADAPQTP